MCGVVGLQVDQATVAPELLQALMMLQHRGQDAAGITTTDSQRIYTQKGLGLVSEVIDSVQLARLKGRVGIGHVRYPTSGIRDENETQPFYVNAPLGLALAHNGHLVNAAALRLQLKQQHRHVNTASDSELLLNVLAHALEAVVQGQVELSVDAIMRAVKTVIQQCQGAYSVVVLIVGYGILAFRDAHGIRPLVWGQRQANSGRLETMIASESVAMTQAGFRLRGDCPPGGAMFVDMLGQLSQRSLVPGPFRPCLFEYVYLARQDSVLNGLSVYRARREMGRALALQVADQPWWQDVDVIMPIPDTSRPAALELAQCLQRPYREGLVKNRYIARTFIMPGQENRQRSIRQKLNPLPEEFAGRHVCLVDDSIVRGNTAMQVVALAKQAGARKVSLLSLSPEVKYANYYGIDMPNQTDLIAYQYSLDAMTEKLGVTGLVFLQHQRLCTALKAIAPHISAFEDSVFTGQYIVANDEVLLPVH